MPLHTIARTALEPSDTRTLLVLLHGLAADENDLIGLADQLDPKLHVLSVRAPYETGYGGYAWFGIQFQADESRIVDEDQASSSLELLVDQLESFRADLTPNRLVLGGFSQGAMMAAGVVMHRPALIDAAWLMSGAYMPILDPHAQPSPHLPIYVQHGAHDPVVPLAEGRQLAKMLASQGHEVRFDEYPMGHQISLESLSDGNTWLQSLSTVVVRGEGP